MTVSLRPYQVEVNQRTYNAWDQGASNVCLVMPTGSGKTTCFCNIASEHQGASCVIAHRQELVTQMSVQLGRQGVEHRIIAPKNVIRSIIREHRLELGQSFYNPQALAGVAGVDTLVSRADRISAWAGQVTLWVQDEAHHLLRDNKWGKAAALFPHAKGLGVTATPLRADGKGLGRHADGLFDAMVIGPSMRDLIEMGSLSDYQIAAPPSDFDIDSLRLGSTGDFTSASLRDASRHSHIVGDVVDHYIRFANGKRGVTFATDVETANHMAEQYRAKGVPAQAVSAKTNDSLRSELIRRFRNGDILQLVNVDLFGEGFDLPAIEVVSMARPTQSLAVFAQQFGRSLRPMPGKDKALIIDHVQNVKRHGLPDIPRQWTLDRREKRSTSKRDPEIVPVTTCAACFMVYERTRVACPHCGHRPDPDGRRKPEQVDGDLTMLDADILEQMRQAAVLETPEEVANRVGYAAGPLAAKGAANRQRERIEAQNELKETIALWAGQQRAMGRDDQESYRRFYLTYGMDVLTALTLSRADSEKLTGEIKVCL